ncbi:9746_t:CDS:2 [Entrophospora sp. SA101]|nr:9746_t:CDS:2 [Entrophospora sp. SA101]
MKEEDWLKYAETSDNLWNDSQMNKFKFPENPGHHDLNRMWDAVRNTLIKTAEKTIPKRWVSESFKDIKSKELIKNYSYLRKVNKILIKFNNIKIYNDKIPSQTEWNKDIKILNNIINNELNLMQQNHINIKHHNEESFSIKGGNTPLYTILKESYYKNTAPLKNRLIMFLDQLRSYDGSYLLTWKEITDKHFNKKKFSRKPKWMESLETSVLLNTNSQKLKPQWPSMTNNVQEIQIPLMNNRKKEWIGAWPTCGSELVLGRIEKKSKNNKIRIEHWNHLIQNIGTTPTSNPPILIQCHGWS